MCSGLGWFKVVGVCVGERRGGVGERSVERGGARRSCLKGRERDIWSIRRTLEPFQRQRWGNLRERRGGAQDYGLFRAHWYRLELN